MRGLGILILIVVFFVVIWPYIARWMKRKAMERAEDYMRAQMGMPPRDKKSRKTGRGSREYSSREYYSGNTRSNPYGRQRNGHEPIIPKEYAEDVEFTETKDYSYTETHIDPTKKAETYHESQISDAEWTEVKKSRS